MGFDWLTSMTVGMDVIGRKRADALHLAALSCDILTSDNSWLQQLITAIDSLCQVKPPGQEKAPQSGSLAPAAQMEVFRVLRREHVSTWPHADRVRKYGRSETRYYNP